MPTFNAVTYSSHGRTSILANRSFNCIFSAISLVDPFTRRAKKLAAQPEPKAYIPIRFPTFQGVSFLGPLHDALTVRPSGADARTDAKAPYKLAVYMLPHLRTQSVLGTTAEL